MESSIVERHHECPKCGSSDAASTYSDGHSYCFSCQSIWGGESSEPATEQDFDSNVDLLSVEYIGSPSRGLTELTCRKAGYGANRTYKGGVRVSQYRKNGRVISQHIRTKDKEFFWLNYVDKHELFMQHLWQEGGKQLIMTEGEEDGMSWYQARNYSWPVVAVPGVSGIKAVVNNFKWLNSFEEIVLFFDMDEPGQKFANEVAALFPPGKVRIGNTSPYKDSNEMLVKAGPSELFKTLYQATTWKPAEVTTPREVLRTTRAVAVSNYGIPALDQLLGGIHASELAVLCAGTNIGKSFAAKHIAFNQLEAGKKVGFIALEETSGAVLDTFLGLANGMSQDEVSKLSQSQLEKMLDAVTWEQNLTFYTDTGEDLFKSVLGHLRYMAASGVDYVVIDHISAVFARITGDQRREIDSFMYELQSICKETGIPVLAVCHLRDPGQGKDFSTGVMPQLSQLNGSSSLSRVPAVVIGVQRNLMDAAQRPFTKLVVLKSRLVGRAVGSTVTLTVDDSTKRLVEVDAPPPTTEQPDYEAYDF